MPLPISSRSPRDLEEFGLLGTISLPARSTAPPGSQAVAVVPAGSEFGVPPGINDRMLIGGARAFDADAKVYQTLRARIPLFRQPCVFEQLHQIETKDFCELRDCLNNPAGQAQSVTFWEPPM